MRLFMVPLIAFGMVAVDQTDEPSEGAMRAAFELRLATQVESAMDFLAETHGPAAVERVRQAGTDQFTVRSFTKKDCQRGRDGYVCAFAVDLTVVNGTIQQTVKGRFTPAPDGRLTFTQES
jgi:hypothetical protein